MISLSVLPAEISLENGNILVPIQQFLCLSGWKYWTMMSSVESHLGHWTISHPWILPVEKEGDFAQEPSLPVYCKHRSVQYIKEAELMQSAINALPPAPPPPLHPPTPAGDLLHGEAEVEDEQVALHTHRVLQQHLHVLHSSVAEQVRHIFSGLYLVWSPPGTLLIWVRPY